MTDRAHRTRPTARRRVALALAVAAVLSGASTLPASAAPSAPAAPSVPAAPQVAPPATDPGIAGPDVVDELAYDLGDEAFQPEGFPGKVELRGKVYAPQAIAGRAPLVILVHGRHVTCGGTEEEVTLEWPCPAGVPEIPSYQGYDLLGRNLASHGMVVVSIGANGVNGNDGYVDDGGASARGQLILETLRRWRAWDASAAGSPFGSRFVGHLDLADVGLMGHSRGGEGVVAAAELNQRTGSPFGIQAVLALAPVDFARRILGTVDLGVVLPYCDGDVSDLQGAAYYDDARYALPGDPASRSTFLLQGANHNYFNTVWTTGVGASDDAEFLGEGPMGQEEGSATGCQAGAPGRLTAGAQAQAGAVLMAGFLRRHLLDDAGLQRLVTGTAPYPASTGSARWTTAHHDPDRLDVARWDTPTAVRQNRAGQLAPEVAAPPGIVCNPYEPWFGDGGPPVRTATTPCPNGFGLFATNDTGVLDVGWSRPNAVVRQPLAPAGVDVTDYDGVRFRIALPDDSRNQARDRQDLTVVVEDATGARASVAVGSSSNSLWRLNPTAPRHSLLNGVRVPLASFAGIDLTRVRAVELRFDRTTGGRAQLADLAFTREDVDVAVGPAAGVVPVAGAVPPCRRSAAARWACTVGHVLLGRDLSAPELATAAAGYPTVAGRQRVVANMVGGPTAARLHQTRFVQRYTQADVAPETFGEILSAAGQRAWERGAIELASALAYSSGSLASSTQIVTALYQTIAGRQPDPAGLAYWRTRVDRGGITTLAATLTAGVAHRTLVVEQRYQQILGRAVDPSGRSHWVAKLAAPGGEQALVVALLTSESFRATAST